MVYNSTIPEKKKQEEDQIVYDKPKLIEQLRQQLPEALRYNYTDEDLFQRALSIRPEWKKLKWGVPGAKTFKPGFWTGVDIIKDQIWNAVTDWVPVTVARSIRGGGNPIADFAKHSVVETIAYIADKVYGPGQYLKFRERLEPLGESIRLTIKESEFSKGFDAWLDDFIKNNISEAEMYSEVPVEFKDDTWINIPFFGKATYGDLEALGHNLGYSVAGMLAAIPGIFLGGKLGAVATSGAFLFRASKDQFVENLRNTFIDYYGEEKGIEQFEKWRPQLEDDINLHAFWEAGPQAFSNILMIGIAKSSAKPLLSIAEKASFVKKFMNNKYANILLKAGDTVWKPAAAVGEELITETITQVKQSEIEADLDLPEGMPKLREEASGWLEAYNDIKTSVFLNTLILGAGTHATIKSSNALLNLLKQKKEEHEASVRNKIRRREVINKTKELPGELDISDVGYVEEERTRTEKKKVEKVEERKKEEKKNIYEKLSAGREYNPEDPEVKAIKGKSPGEKLFNYILKKGSEAIKEIDSMDDEQQYKVISVLGRYITTTDSKANLTSDKGRFDTRKVLNFVFKEAPKPKKQQTSKEGTVSIESDMAELAVPAEEAGMADFLGQVWAAQVEEALNEIKSKEEFDQLVESEIKLQEGKDVLKSKIIEIKKAIEKAGTLKEYVDDINSLLKEVNEVKTQQELGDILEKIDGFQTEALSAKPKKGRKKAQQKEEEVQEQEQAHTQKVQQEASTEVLIQKAKDILSEKLVKLTESFQKEGASEVNIDIANKLLEKVKRARTQNGLKRIAKSINSLEKKLKPKKTTKKIIEKEEKKPVIKKEKEPVVKEKEQIEEKELLKGKKPTDFETAKKITIEKLKTFRDSLKEARVLSKNARLVNSLSKDLVKAKSIDDLRAIYKAINDFENKKTEPVKRIAKTAKTTKATRATNADFKNAKAIVKEKLNNVKKALVKDDTFNKHRGFLSNVLKNISQAKSIDDLRKIYRKISYFEKKYSVKAEPVKFKEYTIKDKKFEQAKKLTKEKITELKKTLEESGTLKENADFIISILDRLNDATNIEELRAIYKELITFTEKGSKGLVRKTKKAKKEEKEKKEEKGKEEEKEEVEDETNDPFPLPEPLDKKTREETKRDNEFDDGGVKFQEAPDDLDNVNYQTIEAHLTVVNVLENTPNAPSYDPSKNNGASFFNWLARYGVSKDQINIVIDLLKGYGKLFPREVVELIKNTYNFEVQINTSIAEAIKYEKGDILVDIKNNKLYQVVKRFVHYTDPLLESIEGSVIDVKDVNTRKITKVKYEDVRPLSTDVEYKRITFTKAYENISLENYRNNPERYQYLEKEIRIPGLFPSVKSHAVFASKNSIGWIRGYYDKQTNTFIVIEIQSDLFQKERESEKLITDQDIEDALDDLKSQLSIGSLNFTEYEQKRKELLKRKKEEYSDLQKRQNTFLQLLNRNNNWVTFFIKAIMQDAARKGNITVLFPRGDTAADVQGTERSRKIIKRNKEKINEIERTGSVTVEVETDTFGSEERVVKLDRGLIEEFIKEFKRGIQIHENYIKKFEFVESFYETRVKNILTKIYKNDVDFVTDEYGHEWIKININSERDLGAIVFQHKGRFGFVRENREIAQKIIDRIGKLYPSIKLESVARIFDKYGREVAGRAFRNIAQWSERYATLDTLAHEPWHIILEAFRDDPLIKLGLRKILFTTVPQFTMQHKTNHAHAYGLLIRDNKQLVKALKDRYDKLSKEEKSLRDKLDPDERFAKYAYPLSLYREAYEAATNTGSAKTFFDTIGVPTDEYNQQFLEDLAIELFTIEIGNYFADRIQNNTLANRIKVWLKQFVLRLKKIFSDLTSYDIIQIVGERYFQGKYALSEDQINSTEEFYEEPVDEDVGDTEEEAVDTKDSNPLIRGGRFFINRLGIYIEKSDLLGIARLAKENDDYNSFIEAMLDYITQKTGVQFKKKNEDIIIIHPDGRMFKYNWNAFRNDQIEFYQRVNSLQERFDPKESPDGKLLTQMMITMSRGSIVSIDEPILPKKEGGVFKGITGETLPERERMSIADYEAQQGRMQRLIIQSIKEIYKKVIPVKNPDKWFIRKIESSDFMFTSYWINTINKKFGDRFLSGALKNNIFFLGELGDDNSHIVFAFVPHEYEYAGKDEFEKYFTKEVKEGRLDETHVDNFREWAAEQKNDPTIHAKLIGYHEVWKSMLGNNYMEYIDKLGLAKVYKYLKLSVSGKGTHVKGSGPARFMIFDPKEVTMEVNGEPVTLLKDDGGYAFDGAQIASGKYLKRLSENNGRLSAILKNVVSYLSPERTDYVALKTLTITAIPGTKLYKDGKLIAELRGSGKETYWYDTINKREFDYLVTMDEVKMATGKFANLYEVHEIPEYATRILIHPGASKKNAVHPLLVADLLADVKFMKDEYAAKFFEELYKHYDNLGIQYVKKFKDLFSNPQELANFILTDLQEGELPTEIHRAATINPKTLLLDHYRNQVMQMVVNNLFADGLFKGRSLKNKGTRLYLKPRFHLKFKDSESIHVSADNKTVYKMLKEASGYHDVDAINTWLEKNDFWVLVHRQPVQGSTKVQVRKIQSIVQGFHGDAIFMSDHDVFRVNEADFDADSVAIEKLNETLEEAWINLQNSEAFKKRNKYVYTEIFKVDKKPTSLSNYSDVMTHLNDNNKSRGSQGLMVNAKTILSTLAFKQFKLELEDDSEISVYNLDDPVIMTDFPLDPDKLTPEMIQKLKDQGDDVYTKYDGDYIPLDELPKDEKPDGYYLYTTKENEFSILLQFAVDNSKLRLLKRIRARTLHEYVLSRMFRGKNLKAMRAVYRIFNYSDILRMKNERGRTATDYETKEMSKRLYLRYYDENGNRLPSSEIAKNILVELLEHTDDAKSVSVNDNISPREHLIIQVYKILGDDSVYDLIQPHEFYAVHGYAREKLNEKYYFELRKNMTAEQFNDVIDLTDKMNQERHRISDEAAKEKNRLAVEQNADTPGQIRYDYNRAFEPFIKEFYDKLQAMTKEQRMLSTLYYLNGAKMINQKGIAVNQERVNYLLPILLMDETILSDYAEFYKVGMDKVRNNELNFNDYKKSAKQTYFRKMTQEGRNGRYC